jgi:hypothetical protein
MSEAAREHVSAMLSNVQRMIGALAEITSRFGLELGDSTPLAIIAGANRRGCASATPG